MYLPLWAWMILFVSAGIYWIYKKVILEPGLAAKEQEYISKGLAKERDDYLLRQVHYYYSINIESLEEISSHIDFEFLKDQTAMSVGISEGEVYIEKYETEQSAFQAILKQIDKGTGQTYQISVTLCKGEEVKYRLPYNIFLTYVENIMKELDANIEVERKLV